MGQHWRANSGLYQLIAKKSQSPFPRNTLKASQFQGSGRTALGLWDGSDYLNLEFRFQIRGEAHSPLLAIIACLALGYWMSNVFFLRTRYYFDPANKELLVRHTSICGRTDKLLSLRHAVRLYVRRGKIKTTVFFDFGIRFPCGKIHLIARARDSEDLPISSFAAATGLSVQDWSSLGDDELSTPPADIGLER